MGFEPQKLFIGLMEFFTILLPGAVLTYLSMGAWGPCILGPGSYDNLTNSPAMGGGAFFVASYVTGHFLFLIGSLLDDLVYGPLRTKQTHDWYLHQLAVTGELPSRWKRSLSYYTFGQNCDLAAERAKTIKNEFLKKLQASLDINTFQWSKAHLAKIHPESLTSVHRFEADSKFFRSFCALSLLLIITTFFNGLAQWVTRVSDAWLIANPVPKFILLLAVFLASLWRYVELRFKAVNQAYRSVITLTAQEKSISIKDDETDSLHGHYKNAGAVVFRVDKEGKREFLAMKPMEVIAPDYMRLYPKWNRVTQMTGLLFYGKMRRHELLKVAAIRHVLEQTGCWTKIFLSKSDQQPILFEIPESGGIPCFLVEYLDKDTRHISSASEVWLDFDSMVKLLNESKTQQELLQEFQEILKSNDLQSST